jgi:hypothetical protein
MAAKRPRLERQTGVILLRTLMKTKLRPQFITDETGKKTSVIINLRDYKKLIEYLEDLEDGYDLLKAEREATDFIPYNTFRQKMLAGKRS